MSAYLRSRELWDRQSDHVWRDIFELESIGPLLVIMAWGHRMRSCLWTHYIDNEAALASMVRGSSSVDSGDIIVGATWQRCIELNVMPWFDRVQSSANPVDGLSRGNTDGPWVTVQPLQFPEHVLVELRSLLSQTNQRDRSVTSSTVRV